FLSDVHWAPLEFLWWTLSLQRQMMENLIIAKARQAALQRKMEERRLRLQEEANRRFSTNATLTPEEEEQRNVYASILEFEQDHEWPKQWKLKLKSQPNDLILVGGLVSQILSCPEHPISQLLKKLQCRIYSKLYPIVNTHFSDQVALTEPNAGTGLYPAQSQCLLNTDVKSSLHKGSRLKSSKSACCLGSVQDHVKNNTSEKNSPFEDLEQDMMKFELQPGSIADNMNLAVNSGQQILETEDMQLQDHLKNIVKDVHNSIDRLLTLCILAFEPLDSATGKDQCLASIEETFFQPIWMFLLALFRKVNHSREMALDKSLKLYRTAGPADVGVSDKLFPHKSTPSIGSYPYEIAVQELRSISKEFCPQKKLECIVRTLRLICDCAEQYCGSRQSGALIVSAIGADDLLPILSYVVLKSNLTQLVSECAALEEFIHEGYLIGEEGYCLTSMQSALLYVESLSKE
uniref:VPS9 domain containing 1 n=1 Tax=Callorhinchus milii TaxID=7868 RepID=A0A4W3INZ4_CALMI